jgi:hypothetical protein
VVTFAEVSGLHSTTIRAHRLVDVPVTGGRKRPDPAVMTATLKMKKLDIAELERAYAG